ncbi:DUF7266 family protein [Halomontanus rarus]|uniref:DUF7266 family protein n=1 Tax=Halomontanus rarus TaxID=3034020 RepID=UPI0023E7BDF3|nr:hypothetical protein [Halovivax sp. TS33]
MTRRLRGDDRAVSVAITHVLTIGITAILISGLMIGAGSMLDSEKERGAKTSLETTGERLAGEIASVDRSATGSGTVTLRVDHPRRVSGSSYSIEFDEDDDCEPLLDETDLCLTLTAQSEDADVQVPVVNETAIDTDASVPGGPITVTYDGDKITLESGHQ